MCIRDRHTSFEATHDRVHPNIFKFLEALHREQNLTEATSERVIAGNPLPKKWKYPDNGRLKGMVARFRDFLDTDNTDDDNGVSEETPT